MMSLNFGAGGGIYGQGGTGAIRGGGVGASRPFFAGVMIARRGAGGDVVGKGERAQHVAPPTKGAGGEVRRTYPRFDRLLILC